MLIAVNRWPTPVNSCRVPYGQRCVCVAFIARTKPVPMEILIQTDHIGYKHLFFPRWILVTNGSGYAMWFWPHSINLCGRFFLQRSPILSNNCVKKVDSFASAELDALRFMVAAQVAHDIIKKETEKYLSQLWALAKGKTSRRRPWICQPNENVCTFRRPKTLITLLAFTMSCLVILSVN